MSKKNESTSSLDALPPDQEEISKSYIGHMRNIYSEDEECLESDGNFTTSFRRPAERSLSNQSLSVTDVQMATSKIERIQRMKRRNSCDVTSQNSVTRSQSYSSLETLKSLNNESKGSCIEIDVISLTSEDLFGNDKTEKKKKKKKKRYHLSMSLPALDKESQKLDKIASKYLFNDEPSLSGKTENVNVEKLKQICIYFNLILFLSTSWMIAYSQLHLHLGNNEASSTEIAFKSSDIMKYAAQVSGSHIVSDTRSPQYQALKWLEDSDIYTSKSQYEFIERYILIILYYSTRGPSWRMNNWLSPNLATCSWYGITCEKNSYGNSVSFISLPHQGLHGTIPSEIGCLNQLTELKLSSNELHGDLPTSITKLMNLEKLDLKNNTLWGDIPELDAMESLRVMKLDHNSFHGTIPYSIGTLLNLEEMHLQYNKLEGKVPYFELINLKKLRKISLSDNLLTGEIPLDGTEVFESLQKLSLNSNMFFGELPLDIGTIFKNLKSLKLAHNGFSGKIPDSLGKMNQLEVLQLESNNFVGNISDYVCDLTGLIELTADCEKVSSLGCECCTHCY